MNLNHNIGHAVCLIGFVIRFDKQKTYKQARRCNTYLQTINWPHWPTTCLTIGKNWKKTLNLDMYETSGASSLVGRRMKLFRSTALDHCGWVSRIRMEQDISWVDGGWEDILGHQLDLTWQPGLPPFSDWLTLILNWTQVQRWQGAKDATKREPCPTKK